MKHSGSPYSIKHVAATTVHRHEATFSRPAVTESFAAARISLAPHTNATVHAGAGEKVGAAVRMVAIPIVLAALAL